MADPTTPPPATDPAPSAGIATTEFWHTMLISSVGAFLVVYGAVVTQTDMIEYGALMLGASNLVYGVSRTLVKRA